MGDRWYASRAVPRPLQDRIGKRLWRVPAGTTLAAARRFVAEVFLPTTDRLIEEAHLSPEESFKQRQEALHIELRGRPAEQIFNHQAFYGTPSEAEALAELPTSTALSSTELVSLACRLKNPADGTRREWQNALRLLAEQTASSFPLSLTKTEAIGFRDHLLSTYKPSTAGKVIRFLSGLWELAKDEGLVSENVFKGLLKHLRQPQREDKPPIPDTTWKLVESLSEANQTLFWLVAYTGMRITEALGLRKQDISLSARTITVISHKDRRLKNDSSRRVIPIDDRLRPFLEKVGEGHLVFPNQLSPSGRWTTPSFWQRRLGYGPHLLRHWFTTKLRTAAVPESVVAGLLGHIAPSQTARYGSVSLEALQEAVRKVEWP